MPVAPTSAGLYRWSSSGSNAARTTGTIRLFVKSTCHRNRPFALICLEFQWAIFDSCLVAQTPKWPTQHRETCRESPHRNFVPPKMSNRIVNKRAQCHRPFAFRQPLVPWLSTLPPSRSLPLPAAALSINLWTYIQLNLRLVIYLTYPCFFLRHGQHFESQMSRISFNWPSEMKWSKKSRWERARERGREVCGPVPCKRYLISVILIGHWNRTRRSIEFNISIYIVKMQRRKKNPAADREHMWTEQRYISIAH